MFHSFCAVVAGSPSKAVIKAVHLEAGMLRAQFTNDQKGMPQTDVQSILTFSEFLQNALAGTPASYVPPPIGHLPFYRKTLERLIGSGDLPWQARDLFNEAFSKAVLAALDVLQASAVNPESLLADGVTGRRKLTPPLRRVA